MAHTIEVRLLAKAAELAGAHTVSIDVQGTTPRDILLELARTNTLLHDQIIREDGIPRSSTRVLVNDMPPSSLDDDIPAGASLLVAVMFPCDG